VRALLVVRPNAWSHPGGDLVHAERTARALNDIGVEATLLASDAPDAAGYDVAHLFGIFEPETARRQIEAVRRHAVPLVLSPIWLDLRPFTTLAPQIERALSARDAAGVERRLRTLERSGASLHWRGSAARAADRRIAAQRALVAEAQVVLPASYIEAHLYGEGLRATALPFVVAHVGVDEETFSVERGPARAGVLCAAARIEPKKNQAALLYALRDVDVDVTVVGRAHDADYLALCRRWAGARTQLVEHMPRGKLREMMTRTAVHAHPSWLETPGLSSLEAAGAGANIVVGDRGSEREYFGPEVDYADPADPHSIRAAVLRALGRPARSGGDALERRLREFTWRRTAEATRTAYELAMARVG
jgi:glycosyltransferase involved in cell wall biosynthesis